MTHKYEVFSVNKYKFKKKEKKADDLEISCKFLQSKEEDKQSRI